MEEGERKKMTDTFYDDAFLEVAAVSAVKLVEKK